MKNYAQISNVFYRADAICADGRGNFGKDAPDGLVYYSGLYLTPTECADMMARDAQDTGVRDEEDMMLGIYNS